MVSLINMAIWLIVLVFIVSLGVVVHALIKKKTMKSMLQSMLVLLASAIILTGFYWPVRLNLPDVEQLSILVNPDNGGFIKLEDPEQLAGLKELLERQKFVRSTDKTVFGIARYPAGHGVHLFITGKSVPYSRLLYARNENVENSFMNKDRQYYTVWNVEPFAKELFAYLEQIEARFSVNVE